jgi:nucleotide-binding universal stress UspA family protein
MKILLAVDGSNLSKGAVTFTRSLPLASAEITLVHVKPYVPYSGILLPTEAEFDVEAFERDIDKQAHKIIDDAETALQLTSFSIKSEITAGQAAEQILHLAENLHVDMIVMGARGHSALETMFLGSIADKVLRHAHRSVLLYRIGHGFTLPFGRFDIALGYDGSDSSNEAIRFLSKWDIPAINNLYLVECAQQEFYQGVSHGLDAVTMYPTLKRDLDEKLQGKAQEVRRMLPATTVHSEAIFGYLDCATELNSAAKKHRCSLLVVGSKGKSLLDRMVLGSVSHRLAHHADMPVLVVR